jgi:uncharacterized membrane protein YkvA (DUF1232 family)
MIFFKNLKSLFKNISRDERIPQRDKKILVTLAALIVSPIDLIPDWIAFFGQIDDLIMFSLIMDYFFRVLDSRVVLSQWPWSMKSFARLRAIARGLHIFVPKFLSKRLWSYTPDPF